VATATVAIMAACIVGAGIIMGGLAVAGIITAGAAAVDIVTTGEAIGRRRGACQPVS
jgi:hypothetical protein